MIRNILGLLLLITSLSAQSEDMTPWPFDGLEGVSGTFTSETQGPSGDTLRSSGRFSSLKPDHYLWDIQTPDSQMLVVNSTGFWQVDRDLDVVILRDVPSSAQLPLSKIWLDEAELTAFSKEVTEGSMEAISAFELRVVSPTLLEMRLVDPLGRETRFQLTIESTVAPAREAFDVRVPPNVDFFDERSVKPTPNAEAFK